MDLKNQKSLKEALAKAGVKMIVFTVTWIFDNIWQLLARLEHGFVTTNKSEEKKIFFILSPMKCFDSYVD